MTNETGEDGRRQLILPIVNSFEHFCPAAETAEAFLAELGQAVERLFNGLLAVQTGFREELVGIADDLLLQRFGQEVAMGQRKLLTDNLLP